MINTSSTAIDSALGFAQLVRALQNGKIEEILKQLKDERQAVDEQVLEAHKKLGEIKTEKEALEGLKKEAVRLEALAEKRIEAAVAAEATQANAKKAAEEKIFLLKEDAKNLAELAATLKTQEKLLEEKTKQQNSREEALAKREENLFAAEKEFNERVEKLRGIVG